ncbi:MAG: hypothetical protein JSV91_01255 [Phycisphaerales bacterium]|nr:MAG: hypothetical protein JSV91_01255 [Phycisphaerales bacterium]
MSGDGPEHDLVNAGASGGRRLMRVEDSLELSRTILHCSKQGLSRTDFLQEVSEALLDLSGCDSVEMRLSDGGLHYRWETTRRPEKRAELELVQWIIRDDGRVLPALPNKTDLEHFCRRVASHDTDPDIPCFTRNGSFFVSDTWEPLARAMPGDKNAETQAACIGGHYRSLAAIRFIVDEKTIGLLLLKSEPAEFFTEESIQFYEGVAQTLGLAIADKRAEAALRERVKELTCLYGIAQIVERPGLSVPQMLHHIVRLLPPSWQFPEITAARIVLDGSSFTTPGFRQSTYRQSANIIVGGRRRGVVEVVYIAQRPEFSAGAFLPEEEKLIVAIAREIALIVEREEAQTERTKLQNQLVHADRLATIGQLAAGVAHELNEPLGSILGFAQLVEKYPDLPAQARQDMERIVRASLYAREVIKKLLVFARQMPPNVIPVNLNRVINDGMQFLEARCAKAGIKVIQNLATDLQEIHADPARLNQILVNLVVNAIQAMPVGGTLTISTNARNGDVVLVVEDSGIGMTDEIVDKIFLPFFTTKDVDEGTGLGLAVVHGIVTSHGGSIDVESRPGDGTRFTVRLPIESPVTRDADDDDQLR